MVATVTAGPRQVSAASMRSSTLVPLVAALFGIALFAAMDAAMKGASLAIGAYSAFVLRCTIGVALTAPAWWLRQRRWPARAAMSVHLRRGLVTAVMGWAFFFGITRVPLAEAIALSFIAPLAAAFLAAWLLGETVRPRAIGGSLAGLAGVAVIAAERIGTSHSEAAAIGIAAILGSALLYAYNLVLQRQQALLASPIEVSAFQNGIVALALAPLAPLLLVLPGGATLTQIGGAALLAIGAALCLTWAYARAETQMLLPTEYTAFGWAALLGWWWFGEAITPATLAGAGLIVIGCLVAARRPRALPVAPAP